MKKSVISVLIAASLLSTAWAKPLTPYNQGYDQGRKAGEREGKERGGDLGRLDGEQDGYNAGFAQAQADFLTVARAEAHQQGEQEGRQQGALDGRRDGEKLGIEEGHRAGETGGRQSADKTAYREVSPEAQAAGLARARSSNPEADALKEGKADGLKRARQTAREEDFARGRADYFKERTSQPAQAVIQQRQSQLSLHLKPLLSFKRNDEALLGRHSRPPCDFRYCQFPSDNEEFQKGFRKGYRSGYESGFDQKYDWYYKIEFQRSARWGANQAVQPDLSADRDEAFQSAYRQAYQTAYKENLAQTREVAYSKAFELSFSHAYALNYPQFRKSHYKEVENKAFESLYRERYQSIFDPTSERVYREVLPEERKRQYSEGRKAEKADFDNRPVRLLDAWVTPTDVGDLALLTVKLRNYSDDPVQGFRVHLFLGDESSRLYHSIPPHSEVVVTGVFKFTTQNAPIEDVAATYRNGEQDLPLGALPVKPRR